MSDRSFRDRLAHIADLVDLEQLDGLVNRGEPSTGDEEPSLHRLILGLEEAGENNHQQVHGGGGGAAAENHHPDDFDALVFGIVPDHIALFGLQHTPLTRAINEGKYELAEKLIASTSDPESFNDGSMVHAMSTGKGAFKSRARNLWRRVPVLILGLQMFWSYRRKPHLKWSSISIFPSSSCLGTSNFKC
jgi:hypothetical protein